MPAVSPINSQQAPLGCWKIAAEAAYLILADADLLLTSRADDRLSLQRRNLESRYRSDQPERLQNPNQHDHEHDDIE